MARVNREELVEMQNTFKTDSAIGQKLGISRQAVHQLRVKYGIDSLTRRNAARNLEIQQQYNSGIPGTDLAKRYNLSVSQTYRIINEMKSKQRVETQENVILNAQPSIVSAPAPTPTHVAQAPAEGASFNPG